MTKLVTKLWVSKPESWQLLQTRSDDQSLVCHLRTQALMKIMDVAVLQRTPVTPLHYPSFLNRNQDVGISKQLCSKCGSPIVSPSLFQSSLSCKVVWQVVKTLWNLFLGDKFFLWLVPSFSLILLAARHNGGNSRSSETIVSIIWQPKGSHVSLLSLLLPGCPQTARWKY